MSWSDSTRYYSGNFVDGWARIGDLGLHADDTSWVSTGELAGATYVWSVLEASNGSIYAGTFPNGDVFVSSDAGASWDNTGELVAATRVSCLIESSGGTLYAGTSPDGNVYRSTDWGTAWANTGELLGATSVYSLIETPDGPLYAGTMPGGDVFKSTDSGGTWYNTGELAGATEVWALIRASDGALYAGTYPGGDVFKSVDAGTTWANTGELAGAAQVYSLVEIPGGLLFASTGFNGDVFLSSDGGASWANTGELAGVSYAYSLLEASGGVLYAGTDLNGSVFRSVDAGTTWASAVELSGATLVHSLMQCSNGVLYAGTGGNGDVLRTLYLPAGDIVSSVYDVGSVGVTYGIMTWTETLNDETLYLCVRTDTYPDMFTAPGWDTCPPVVNGQDISDLSSVDDGEQYVQYRAGLSSSSPDVSPVLHEVVIEYDVPGVEEHRSRSDDGGRRFALRQCRPNPFQRSTYVSFSLAASTDVALEILNVAGRLLETLVNGKQGAGVHHVRWNRSDNPSGVYFCRLRAGGFVEARKMVVID
jgi:photosystem II stability/assembly factor-like uncharacterized protein